MKTTNAKKLSVTIRADLLERMDNYAHENGLSRSGLIGVAVSSYLNSMEAVPSVNKMLAALAALADGAISGEIDLEEAKTKMEAIQLTLDTLKTK